MNLANRPLLILYFISYLVSFALLLIASLSKTPVPVWGGYLDVTLVIFIVFLGFIIFGRGKSNPQYQAGHRAALNIIPIVLLGMWILRNRFDFNILLPGLAWRVFFLLHILPYSVVLWNPEPSHE